MRCLIAVKSDFLIKDTIATVFSKLVYQELLFGSSVVEAFENAKVKLRIKFKEECESCCCGHSHLPDCEWYSIVESKGRAEVHDSDSGPRSAYSYMFLLEFFKEKT